MKSSIQYFECFAFVELHDVLALVSVLDLVVLEFFPHFVVPVEDVEVLPPHPLESGHDSGDFNVHKKVNELEAGQQVFEAQAAQHLVDALCQERVETHVHLFLTGELALHFAAPDQVDHC